MSVGGVARASTVLRTWRLEEAARKTGVPGAAAGELARAVAQPLVFDPDEDPLQVALAAIRHRVRHGWLVVEDVEGLASSMAQAWRRA